MQEETTTPEQETPATETPAEETTPPTDEEEGVEPGSPADGGDKPAEGEEDAPAAGGETPPAAE